MQGERRVVTVLFCDVADSTAMAERLDPEEWAEIMNEAFRYLTAPVTRYGGNVARLMGDAILAFFGAPVAHEDDPQRATLAALDIVEGIKPFREEMEREYDLDFNVRVPEHTLSACAASPRRFPAFRPSARSPLALLRKVASMPISASSTPAAWSHGLVSDARAFDRLRFSNDPTGSGHGSRDGRQK